MTIMIKKCGLIFQFFLFFISYFLFITCSDSSAPNGKVTFSGTVTLEGTEDFSGVTVSLYKPVELDTALVRINQQYPNIGVQISQETEFDHRLLTPLATTKTAVDGSWEIEADEGVYNVVVEKEGYGWRYEYEKTNQVTFATNLYNVIEVSGIYFNDFTFEENKFYKLSGEVVFASGTNLKVEKAIIVAEKNASIRLVGGITTNISTGFVLFTSENLNETWKGVTIEAVNNNIINVKIINARDGLSIKANNNKFDNCYIKNASVSGIRLTNSITNTLIQNLLINYCDTGIDMIFVDSTNTVNKCIISHSNEEGASLNESKTVFLNTIFINNTVGTHVVFNSNAKIRHCLFEKNKKFGLLLGGSDPEIMYNTFMHNMEIAINVEIQSYTGDSEPKINYNNLINSTTLISIIGIEPNPNRFNIDAINNWWGTTDALEISNRIFDKSDIEETSPFYDYTGLINYKPYEMEPILIAYPEK